MLPPVAPLLLLLPLAKARTEDDDHVRRGTPPMQATASPTCAASESLIVCSTLDEREVHDMLVWIPSRKTPDSLSCLFVKDRGKYFGAKIF
ncbi:hypothetical protein U9M48_002586 [Paspalum notatum var. saurae]|uniref:Secreted protein n=1 Tax=Paspalum notatum var. saurae TaxID=547442 RepID=A0AAQ3SJX9_PASNO